MTRKDLNSLFSLRERIARAEDMLIALRARSNPGAQILTGMPHATGVQDKTGDFATETVGLEEKIKSLKDVLNQREREVSDFLNGIDNECVSTALRLRYIRGFLWKEISYILDIPQKSITYQCYEYLKTLDNDTEDGESADMEIQSIDIAGVS